MRLFSRSLRRFFACTMLVGALAGSDIPAHAAEPAAPYELNAILPLTGGGAFLGSDFVQTLKALELVVNRSGRGRPLKFVVADSTSSPIVSLSLVNALVAKRVPAIIDGGPSGVCNPSISLVQTHGPVLYCLSPSVHPEANSFAFSAGVSIPTLVDNLLRYARLKHWVRIAAITSTDATGSDFDQQLARALQDPANADIKLVRQEHFNVTDLTVAAQIARIKAANPQTLITWSTGTPFGTQLHGIRDAGLDIPVFASPANQTFTQFVQYAGVLPKDLYFTSALAVTKGGIGKGPVQDAQRIYYDAFKAIGFQPDFSTSLAWDPIMIIIDALRALDPDATADQIRTFIVRLHSWAGINGIYDFRDGSQRGLSGNVGNIQRWDATRNDFVAASRPGGIPL